MKTVLAFAFVIVASYLVLNIAIDIASVPFQQVAEVINATNSSSNF